MYIGKWGFSGFHGVVFVSFCMFIAFGANTPSRCFSCTSLYSSYPKSVSSYQYPPGLRTGIVILLVLQRLSTSL
jgi:hypothetical protein